MFAKLLLTITVFGLTAIALLVTRQARLDAAHRMSRAHERIVEHERALWDLQAEIAQRSGPDEVRRLMTGVPADWHAVPAP